MDFEIPADIQQTLAELDAFIEAEIVPLAGAGRQRPVLRPPPGVGAHRLRQRRRAAGRLGGAAAPRCAAGPTPPGGCGSRCPPSSAARTRRNLEMAIIREHLATKGLGLHNDLQNESSIVGNFPTVLMMRDFGTDEQKRRVDARLPRRHPPPRVRPHRAEPRLATPPSSRPPPWPTATSGCINGTKRFNSGLHHATHDIIFARTSGDPGLAASASPPSSCRPTRPASTSTSSGGRSTCRPTTPR